MLARCRWPGIRPEPGELPRHDATDAVLAHAERVAAKGLRAKREAGDFAERDKAARQSLLALLTADEDAYVVDLRSYFGRGAPTP